MLEGRLLWISATLISILASQIASQEIKNACMDASTPYPVDLGCDDLGATIQVVSVIYGANTEACTDACCVEEHVQCTEESNEAAATNEVMTSCGGQHFCRMESLEPISMECASQEKAEFITITYNCVIATTTTTQTTTATPTTVTSESTTRMMTTRNEPTVNDGLGDQPNNETNEDKDLGLIIGLSVGLGAALIITVVIIVIVITAKKRRRHSTDLSTNSTKTLATSDAESPDTSGNDEEDAYGFTSNSSDQKERLDKRNEGIKRNLSFKTEEKAKNGRKKGGKSKKSSGTLNTNNSNSKTHKNKKSSKNGTVQPKESQKNEKKSAENNDKKQIVKPAKPSKEKEPAHSNNSTASNGKTTPPAGDTKSSEISF